MSERRHRPRSRRLGGELLTERLDDELVVYDRQHHEAHCLNPTARLLLELCDGSRSIEQLGEALREREPSLSIAGCEELDELVRVGLEALDRARLLEPVAVSSPVQTTSRREALKLASAAALVPVVYTLVAPHPVAAQSGPAICGQQCHPTQGIFCPPGCRCSKLTGNGVCLPI